MKKNGTRYASYDVEFLGVKVAVAEKSLDGGRYLTIIAGNYDVSDIRDVKLVVHIGRESAFENDDEPIEDLDEFEGDERAIIRYDAYSTIRETGQSLSMFNLDDKNIKVLTTLLDEFVKYINEIELI